LLDLRGDPDAPLKAYVIESRLDKGKGVSLTRSILSFSVDIIAPPVFLVSFIVSQCITHCQA